jgi:hypothetical protein
MGQEQKLISQADEQRSSEARFGREIGSLKIEREDCPVVLVLLLAPHFEVIFERTACRYEKGAPVRGEASALKPPQALGEGYFPRG